MGKKQKKVKTVESVYPPQAMSGDAYLHIYGDRVEMRLEAPSRTTHSSYTLTVRSMGTKYPLQHKVFFLDKKAMKKLRRAVNRPVERDWK